MPDVPVLTRRFPANCVANSTFQIFMNGGDGSEVQFCAHVHRAVSGHLHADWKSVLSDYTKRERLKGTIGNRNGLSIKH